MLLYWLVYRHHNHICVVVEPGASLVHARHELALLSWIKACLPKAPSLIAGVARQAGQAVALNVLLLTLEAYVDDEARN
jgi:hypothetical protein